MQHLSLLMQEYGAIEDYKRAGLSPRNAVLAVRPELARWEFTQNNINITLYDELAEREAPVFSPASDDGVTEQPVIEVVAAPIVHTEVVSIPFVEPVESESAASVEIAFNYVDGVRVCNVPGCGRAHRGRGLCKLHYKYVYERKTKTYEALVMGAGS